MATKLYRNRHEESSTQDNKIIQTEQLVDNVIEQETRSVSVALLGTKTSESTTKLFKLVLKSFIMGHCFLVKLFKLEHIVISMLLGI